MAFSTVRKLRIFEHFLGFWLPAGSFVRISCTNFGVTNFLGPGGFVKGGWNPSQKLWVFGIGDSYYGTGMSMVLSTWIITPVIPIKFFVQWHRLWLHTRSWPQISTVHNLYIYILYIYYIYILYIPLKLNRLVHPKITQLKRTNHLNQTSIFIHYWVPTVSVSRVYVVFHSVREFWEPMLV